ncbi:MAG TPA: hypothetical protein VLM37_12375 [Fibrobacteraceae bacterium]|nr:hypothetical protein [Fibrobacteraceae bacterium]
MRLLYGILGKRSYWFAGLCLASFVASPQAQTCMLNWNVSESTGCISVSDLSGDTIEVPSNVTRLGESGLKICGLNVQSATAPAIIFIMDQSTSMDTTSSPGDPQHWRDDAARNAIQYLYDLVGSTAAFAYIEFADSVAANLDDADDCPTYTNVGVTQLRSDDFMTLTDSTREVWTSSDGPIQVRCNSGTNYYEALRQAKTYANAYNPPDVIPKVSVIFLSDGSPTWPKTDVSYYGASYSAEGAAYLPLDTDFYYMSGSDTVYLEGEFPPVYGIFLGSSEGGTLSAISSQTGGEFYSISSGDTVSLWTAMQTIIDSVAKVSSAGYVSLTVGGVTYTDSSVSVSNNIATTDFGSNIPLSKGINEIVITVVYRDEDNKEQTQLTTFYISVTGSVSDTGSYSSVDTSGYFSMECVSSNTLIINDSLQNPLLEGNTTTLALTDHILSDGLTSLSLKLGAEACSQTSTKVRIESARTGDVDSVDLSALSTGIFVGEDSLEFVSLTSLGIPIQGDTTDGILQVAAFDTLFFHWVNPDDSRDTLTASLLLYSIPSVAFAAETLSVDQISSSVVDAAVSGIKIVSVSYLWGGTDDILESDAYLSRVDSGITFTTPVGNIDDYSDEMKLARTSDYLVVSYTDPIFGETYSDTVYLVFDTPIYPTAAIYDGNGDGRADTLRLFFSYSDSLTPWKVQSFDSYELVWGPANEDTATMFGSITKLLDTSAGVVTERWIFPLKTPFTFAHTSGSQSAGAGLLTISGEFEERALSYPLVVADSVGPVLTDFWLDPDDNTLTYFTVSENLGTAASDDWILDKRGSDAEVECRAFSTEMSDSTGVYTLELVDAADNRIYAGDSMRLAFPKNNKEYGVTDLAGNYAHVYNPYVVARGSHGPTIDVALTFESSLVETPADYVIPEALTNSTVDVSSQYQVLVSNTDSTFVYTYEDENGLIHVDTISDDVTTAMPVVNITIELPQLYGTDASTGGSLTGWTVENESGDTVLAYSTKIHVETMFYDQLGQYVGKKTANILVNDSTVALDSSLIQGDDGNCQISLLWQTDPEIGLTSNEGRAVGAGVLIAKTTINMVATAMTDIEILNPVTGYSDSDLSLVAGTQKKTSKVDLARIGYRRK